MIDITRTFLLEDVGITYPCYLIRGGRIMPMESLFTTSRSE